MAARSACCLSSSSAAALSPSPPRRPRRPPGRRRPARRRRGRVAEPITPAPQLREITMPLLNPRDQDYLRGRFAEELENPVKIVHFTQNAAVSQLIIPGRENCLYCRETRELMEEVAGLTDKIELEVHEFRPDAPEAAALGISRVPATVIQGTNKGRVRYFG